jgi:hypothetical protein
MMRHARGIDMIKSILAIAAAAACAGVVVLAPEFAPKSAMAATQSAGLPMQGLVVVNEKPQSDGGCSLHWPYYEQNCLRDARLPNGVERVVRVIAIDRGGKH